MVNMCGTFVSWFTNNVIQKIFVSVIVHLIQLTQLMIYMDVEETILMLSNI